MGRLAFLCCAVACFVTVSYATNREILRELENEILDELIDVAWDKADQKLADRTSAKRNLAHNGMFLLYFVPYEHADNDNYFTTVI